MESENLRALFKIPAHICLSKTSSESSVNCRPTTITIDSTERWGSSGHSLGFTCDAVRGLGASCRKSTGSDGGCQIQGMARYQQIQEIAGFGLFSQIPSHFLWDFEGRDGLQWIQITSFCFEVRKLKATRLKKVRR